MSDNRYTVKVTADATGYTAEMDRGRKSAQAFMQTQEDAAKRVQVAQQAIAEAATNGSNASARAINNFVSQLQRTADTAGKTRAELLSMRAAQLGVADSVSSYIKTISDASQHTHEFSLSSTAARRELLVLAHEASQGSWKQFGGSLLVLGERTDALSLLLSGAGVTAGIFAAALFAVGKAAVQGADETKQFNAALQLTNNYAGLTASVFSDMAERVSFLSGSGLQKASDTLRGLAASGQYTSQEMEGLATVILRTSEVSGEALKDVEKEYAKLAENPVKWAYEHNQSMHFMDTATYQHIQALQEAGDKHQAIQAVIDAATAQVASSTTTHLSTAATAWHNLSATVSTFWAKLKQGLSSGPSLSDRISTLEAEREAISSNPLAAGRIGEINKQIAALGAQQKAELDAAAAAKKNAETQQAGVEAAKRLDTLREQTLTNAQKRQKELLQLAKDRDSVLAAGGKFSDADYAKMVSNVQDKYKDQKTSSTGVNSAINAQLARLQGINKLIQDEEKRSETVLKAQRDSGLIDAASYLQKLHDLQANALDQEIANAQQRANVARGKKEQAAYETANAEIARLTEQRKQLDTTLTDDLQKLAATRAANVAKFGEQQAESLRQQTSGYSDAYNTRNMTANEKEQYQARARLAEDYQKQIAQLKEKFSGPTADQQEYAADMALAQQHYEESTAALEQNLATQKQIRDSYTEQFQKAYVGLVGDSQTSAEAMVSGFKTAFDAVGSGLDTFITTGKASFSSFATSVLADLAKIALHQAEIMAFKGVGSALGYFSDGGSVGHFASGGAISGAGTGTSDSIPAMLSNGEFVVRASQASKYRSLLESINTGRMAHFASGGAVGAVSGGGGGSVTNNTALNLNLQGGSLTPEDLAAIAPQIQAVIDKRLDKKMRGQGGYAWQIKNNRI